MNNNNSYLLQEIKQRYEEILEPAGIITGKPSYVCPVCGNGSGPDGTGIQPDPHGDGTQFHCFKCGTHGDILDFYQKANNCTLPEAIRALAERLAIPADFEDWRGPIHLEPVKKTDPETIQAQDQTKEKKDFSEYYKKCQQNLTRYPEALEYLTKRGITKATAELYGIGYDPEYVNPDLTKTPRIIFPTSNYFFTARDITGEQKAKYLVPAGNPKELFNSAALYDPEGGYCVFINEGIIDALAVIQSGQAATALPSASDTKLLITALENQKTEKTLLLLLDSDKAGTDATKELAKELDRLGIPYLVSSPEILSGGYKDPGEIWQKDRASFLERINEYARRAEERSARPDNVSLYLQSGAFDQDKKTFNSSAGRKTGFEVLDRMTGGLNNGLYVLGAGSSAGKTTFALQMACGLARNGHHTIYFSLEQTKAELISKCIARETARRIRNKPENLTAVQIRKGEHNAETEKAAKTLLQEVGDRLSIYEGGFDTDITQLVNYTEKYISANKCKPVVIVDYLQIITAAPDPDRRRSTEIRALVESNVVKLKLLSKKHDIPVFLICSLNRDGYLQPFSLEALKETGLLEYSADVVAGLQFQCVHDKIFKSPTPANKPQRSDMIEEAKDENPRKMELVIPKNRYGKTDIKIKYEYYPAYDLFQEIDTTTLKPKVRL